MAHAADIAARLEGFLSGHLHLDIPPGDVDLFETGVFDSLTFVEVLLHLERDFGIKVSLEELELDRFRTIGRIVEFILSRNGQKPAVGDAAGSHDGPAGA